MSDRAISVTNKHRGIAGIIQRRVEESIRAAMPLSTFTFEWKSIDLLLAKAFPDDAETADLRRQVEELTVYKVMFERALTHVNKVFQTCAENPNPILPDYCKLGDDKFEAVVRLAEDYKDLRWQVEEKQTVLDDAEKQVDSLIEKLTMLEAKLAERNEQLRVLMLKFSQLSAPSPPLAEREEKYSWPLGTVVSVDCEQYRGAGILTGWIRREWHTETHALVQIGNGNVWEYPISTIRSASKRERMGFLRWIRGTQVESVAKELKSNRPLLAALAGGDEGK